MTFAAAFLRVARRHGSREAVVGAGVRWTYRELAARAGAYASALRAAGAGPETVVALAMERGPERVAALLGVWGCRAAFLPLDLSLPRRSLAFQLRDAGVRLALADGPGRRALSGLNLRFAAPRARGGALEAGRPGDLAYVIYTSGTTGRPKGVAVEQRGLLPMLESQIPVFGLKPGKRALLTLSSSFDASLSDIGTALLSGAALVAEPERATSSLSRIMGLLERERITHWDLPPSLLAELESLPASLETLIIGGEAAPPALVRRWARRLRVVNVYGPTEATVCSSLGVCGGGWSRPLIGHPVRGTSYEVSPEGELLISGPGLARGYLGLPELTRERFPVIGKRRVYRTGDKVRLLKNGGIEFLGRLDRQIKVKGLRIEPEGIERELERVAGVAKAVVGVKAAGKRRVLTAWVEPKAGANISAARLRRALGSCRLEIVGAIPRTLSGKADAGSLAEPPRAEELALARIWKSVLGLRRVGRHERFEALGGDSLAALAVTAAAEAAGLALPEGWHRRDPSVAELARSFGAGGAARAAELRRDAGPRVVRRLGRAAAVPREILLTGATGFLGTRLLLELLARTSARITCLVRADSGEGAARRVAAALGREGLALPPRAARRLAFLPGDAERPRLGLSRAVWERLARRTDWIYHCAARVNLSATYEDLRAANVGGCEQILRLMAAGRPKRLHYASTLSVLVSTDRGRGLLREDDELEGTRLVFGGYAQSKWAAEILLRRARVGPISYYRFGLLTGDARRGRGPERDLLGLFIRGLGRLRCAPRAAGLAVDVTPVDFAAAAMASLSLSAPNGTFHVANPRSLSAEELIAAVAARRPLRRVSLERWRALAGAGGSSSPAFLALARALGGRMLARRRPFDLFQATGVRFSMDRTLAGLKGTGLSCPPPRRALIDSYVRASL